MPWGDGTNPFTNNNKRSVLILQVGWSGVALRVGAAVFRPSHSPAACGRCGELGLQPWPLAVGGCVEASSGLPSCFVKLKAGQPVIPLPKLTLSPPHLVFSKMRWGSTCLWREGELGALSKVMIDPTGCPGITGPAQQSICIWPSVLPIPCLDQEFLP